jgi:hypothetical protein
MRIAVIKNGGMAEWFKAAVLKTASRKSGRGFGDPAGGGGESEALHRRVYRAKRASTSYSFVVDEKKLCQL